MAELLERLKDLTVGEKVAGTAGMVVALGILAVLILAVVGWGYTWKFGFNSTDNGNVRSVTLTQTQKSLVRLYLVVSLVVVLLGIYALVKPQAKGGLYF